MPARGALARDSAARVNARLPMLLKVSRQERVRPEVLAKALATVDRDLDHLADDAWLRDLSDAERTDAKMIRDSGKAFVASIKNLPTSGGPGAPPEQARTLEALLSFWGEAEDILADRRTFKPYDQSGRRQFIKRLKGAAKDLDGLADAGLLSSAEAGLLKKSLDELCSNLVWWTAPPWKPAGARYLEDTPQDCAGRLAECLPLLEKVAAQERLRPQIMNVVMVLVRRDLETLEGRLDYIQDEAERARTRKLHEAAKAVAQKIAGRLKENASAAKQGKP
jgi:hypothetical protein